MVSHSSGQFEDITTFNLAVASYCGQIQTSSDSRTDRR